jgi:hypothetical protein
MEEPKPEPKPNEGLDSGLVVKPVKMARKVSFRDQVKPEPLEEVHYIPSNKNINTSEGGCLSCMKCIQF